MLYGFSGKPAKKYDYLQLAGTFNLKRQTQQLMLFDILEELHRQGFWIKLPGIAIQLPNKNSQTTAHMGTATKVFSKNSTLAKIILKKRCRPPNYYRIVFPEKSMRTEKISGQSAPLPSIPGMPKISTTPSLLESCPTATGKSAFILPMSLTT